MARYKVTKEQVERLVENFVMEAAAPEAKKHVKGSVEGGDKLVTKRSNTPGATTKDWGRTDKKKHAPEAKKHVKGSENQNEEDGQPAKTEKPDTKKKQAPEAKKHVKGSVSENRRKMKRRVKR